jgi:hypothetical protein
MLFPEVSSAFLAEVSSQFFPEVFSPRFLIALPRHLLPPGRSAWHRASPAHCRLQIDTDGRRPIIG